MTYLLLSGQIKSCMYEKQLLIIITVHVMLTSFISISNAFTINLYSTDECLSYQIKTFI